MFTTAQLKWLRENHPDLLEDAWGKTYRVLATIGIRDGPGSLTRGIHNAIAAALTRKVDGEYGLSVDKFADGWRITRTHPYTEHREAGPTREQAELAALGCPDEIVNESPTAKEQT